MKVICVRIGNKYGTEYEEYLEKKLPYEFIWVREPINDRVTLQWNKMAGMALDCDEPICVMDIDVLLINDYEKIFEHPVERGEFLAMPGWWRDTEREGYSINGGFFKYYPEDCRYIYEKFMSDIGYWQQYYIKNGVTRGPVNGEQYFVEDSVRERLKLTILPNAWFTRWVMDDSMLNSDERQWQIKLMSKYRKLTGNEYIYMGGEFHPDIKFVHFTHAENKPHLWRDYDKHN